MGYENNTYIERGRRCLETRSDGIRRYLPDRAQFPLLEVVYWISRENGYARERRLRRIRRGRRGGGECEAVLAHKNGKILFERRGIIIIGTDSRERTAHTYVITAYNNNI